MNSGKLHNNTKCKFKSKLSLPDLTEFKYYLKLELVLHIAFLSKVIFLKMPACSRLTVGTSADQQSATKNV